MAILLPLIILLVFEYIGDFLWQDREMAQEKSKDPLALASHLCRIGATLLLSILVLMMLGVAITPFAGYAFVCSYLLLHGIQDWFIWRGYAKIAQKRFLKEYKDDPFKELVGGENHTLKSYLEGRARLFMSTRAYAEDKVFYDFIGLDRLLHVATLIILYGIFLI